MKIGIDIGGSHVGIGLVDEFGNIQQKKEKYIVEKIENESQINKQNLKEEITQFIIQTIKEYQKMDFVENVGIAVPGTVNQTTIIKAVNLGIENYEITPIIEKETGTKVKLKNDAKCSALAEQKYGNFSECENGLFLCIGTGVGYLKAKSIIIIRCGIEIKNYEKAVSIIKDQLQQMLTGDFTEEDLESAKQLIYASVKSIPDTQDGELMYYFSQELSNKFVSLDQYIDNIKKVTKEEIIKIAPKMKINTIYFLTGEE